MTTSPSLRLALYQPDMPPNTGAMLRLGACMGVAVDIIQPCGFVFDDKKLRRAGMDYIDQVDYTLHASWKDFLTTVGTRRLVLLTTKAAVPYHHATFKPDDILLLGRESAGVPDDVHARADARIIIPMQPPARVAQCRYGSRHCASRSATPDEQFLYRTSIMTTITPLSVADQKETASVWFRSLRDQISAAFEKIEDDYTSGQHSDIPAGRFERKEWNRTGGELDGGGGEMSIMRGRVFEKVGINISTVHGEFSPEFRKQIPGATDNGLFWASGISLVAHMRSPLVPAVHMNTRHIVTDHGWFGGGADLTPMFFDAPETAEDKKTFHAALQDACDQHDPAYYEKFSKWCDDYFFLPHRNETRGVGGIFYDYLKNDWAKDFAFTQDVGRAFLATYPAIVSRRMNMPWTPEQREQQLIRRGRYAEFNLLYDRGTVFGLKTNGNTEAILMSLPPEAMWP